jgi:hypothetical protein
MGKLCTKVRRDSLSASQSSMRRGSVPSSGRSMTKMTAAGWSSLPTVSLAFAGSASSVAGKSTTSKPAAVSSPRTLARTSTLASSVTGCSSNTTRWR